MQVLPQPAQGVRGWISYLDAGIYFFFILFAILLPWSIKGARYAWMVAFALWLVQVVFGRKPIRQQPLAAPLLAYLLLSAVSTAFSYDPYLSWPHMRLVCWGVMVGLLFAQNLQRLSQVRTLILLLLLSATAVAGFTAWQYLHGIGLQIVEWSADSPLTRAGLRGDDILVSANGHRLRSPQDIPSSVQGLPPDTVVQVRYLRGLPLRKKETLIRADQFASAVLPGSGMTFRFGRPSRAEGTLKHPMVLAEVMMPLACLAWALMLGTNSRKRALQLLFALIFVALTATVFATLARAALTGLLVGCFVAAIAMGSRRSKLLLVSVLLVVAAGGALWVDHTRGLQWIDLSDPGTRYRLVMWQDGMRLALHHPLTGVGMETIQNHWTEWNLRGFSEFKRFWHFHSDIVQISAERGFLTLAAWLWFVVGYLMYLVRLVSRMRTRSQYAWSLTVGILGGFVAFLFVSLVQYTLGDDTMLMLLFFLYGTSVAIERMRSDTTALDVA